MALPLLAFTMSNTVLKVDGYPSLVDRFPLQIETLGLSTPVGMRYAKHLFIKGRSNSLERLARA